MKSLHVWFLAIFRMMIWKLRIDHNSLNAMDKSIILSKSYAAIKVFNHNEWILNFLINYFRMSYSSKTKFMYSTLLIYVCACVCMYLYKCFQSSLTHLAFSSLSFLLIINKLTVINYSSVSYQLKTIIYIWIGWEIQMLKNLPGSVTLI